MNSEPDAPSREIPVNILIVDDHAENRTALRAILSVPGYRIFEAGSGEDALLLLLEHDFAVLLLDVVMPGFSGFDLAKAVKEREKTANIPVLFLTAHATDADLVYKGYSVGAVDYMIKPLVPEMVRAKVAVFADLYRQRVRNEQQAQKLLEAERKENEFRLLELRLASARRYRALADAVPHIVWTARPDGTVDYFNQRWFEYTGLSVEQAAGSWFQVLHPDDVQNAREQWQKCLQSGEMLQIECRLRRSSDGEYHWHLCRAVPERSTSGEVLSFLGTFTDIQEQKRIQQMLTKFKRTLDAEPDAVVMFDPRNYRISYVNQGVCALLGYRDEELLGMSPVQFMADHDANAFRQVLEPLLQDSAPHLTIETRFLAKDPHASAIDVSLQIIRIREDRIVMIARDVTERNRAQVERELLYREAINAIRVRDEFLSVASHELRTPLSALQLQLQMLLKPTRDAAPRSPEEVKAKLERANRQVERLTRLLGELMDVSKISAGRLQLELEEVDLVSLVHDVVDRLSEEAARRHCPVEFRGRGRILGTWDKLRIEQVVTNLMTNAFKFGAEKPVEVDVVEQGDRGRLTVRDHGIGIAAEDVDRIFQRYEQAISAHAVGGMGLGLYIARQIIEAHQGTIQVESQPGQGSLFTIDLPKHRREITDARDGSEEETATA